MESSETVFLKIGGSLITDKSGVAAARPGTISRIAAEIRSALDASPGIRLVLGHGSGSFGHVPARSHGTRQGVSTPAQWAGFGEVWHQAALLNRIVIDALRSAGLPALAFPASANAISEGGKLVRWDCSAITAALEAGLLPVVYGDVVFDRTIGGTIASTEDLFVFLAGHIRPGRVLIAGVEAGVWADFPARTQLIAKISPENYEAISVQLGGSVHADVTGGMEAKVREMLSLAGRMKGTPVRIFSGAEPGMIAAALAGVSCGTLILA